MGQTTSFDGQSQKGPANRFPVWWSLRSAMHDGQLTWKQILHLNSGGPRLRFEQCALGSHCPPCRRPNAGPHGREEFDTVPSPSHTPSCILGPAPRRLGPGAGGHWLFPFGSGMDYLRRCLPNQAPNHLHRHLAPKISILRLLLSLF